MRSYFAFLFVLFGAVGCSSSEAPTPATVCVAGQTQSCVGPAGCSGGQSCKDDGSGYTACDCGSPADTGTKDTSGSDGPLDTPGDAAICTAGNFRCTGDNLEGCNTTGTGWDLVKACPAGLCNAGAKACDECKPGTKGCVSKTPETCDSTGHWKLGTPCSGSTPSCSAGMCVAGSTSTYSDSFLSGVAPTTTQCTNWETFVAGLTGTYTKVTLKGSLDTVGVSCTGANADKLCNALRTNSTVTGLSCDGRNWSVGPCPGKDPGIIANDTIPLGGCGCIGYPPDPPGWGIRPCAASPGWGGMNGKTCSAADQTLTITCE